MLRFLFWNYRYHGVDRESLLADLIHREAVDVVILAESSIEDSKFLDQLLVRGRDFSSMPIPHDLIRIYAGFSEEVFIEWVRDEGRLCLRRFRAPGHTDIILGAVHLTSGLRLSRSERKSEVVPLARAIREAQRERRHARTIIVGDFNLNPFDDGMIFTDGFGAMTTKSLVKKYARSHNDKYSRFYNPLWSRLGREVIDGPPGTYYWNKHRNVNIYWNYIDQVLVGHDLLDHFPESQFRILTSIPAGVEEDETFSLIRETKSHWKLNVSDHLPLMFDLNLPMEQLHA